MPKINVLPKSVAELIAAGEVVERPSSAVKELIENSIDAGASHITVEIKNGGVKYIRVTDNGCGIHKEDVRTAFISHATSKIKTGEDLDAIFTLGFRGEALPSIAAVSKLSLLTKTEDEEIGTLIEIEGGEEISFDDAGCPDGTTIIIKDLFFNTPARMKFLKKDMTEGTYVSDVVCKTAISHPKIRFTLIKDGKTVLNTPGNGMLKDTVYSVFGKEVSEALIPVEYEYNAIRINGYISRPLNNRPNRNMQYCFVNGRYVRVPVASAALDEAYKNRIMVGKFPMCFLFMEIPAGKIDVNVHPAKTEIRFSEDTKVFEAIFYSAKSALNKGDNLRPEITLRDKKDITAKKEPQTVQMKFTAESVRNASDSVPEKSIEPEKNKENNKSSVFACENASDKTQSDCVKNERQSQAVCKESLQVDFTVKSVFSEEKPIGVSSAVKNERLSKIDIMVDDSNEEQKKPDKAFSLPVKKDISVFRDTSGLCNNLVSENTVNADKDRAYIGKNEKVKEETHTEKPVYTDDEGKKEKATIIVGEVFETYILVEEGDKLLVIDKHAAHERIIFNSLSEGGFSSDSQYLLTPVSVPLTGKEYAAVLENREVFEKGGFSVDDFGGGTIIVRACPVTLQKEDVSAIITEMAGELLRGNMRPVPEKLTWLYHSTACRAAVKAGDRLDIVETEALVKKLLSDESIRYCPHGRPVMYELKKHEIEKQFGRV